MTDEHSKRCNEAFHFQGVMSAALPIMKRIAETGKAFDWQEAMTPEARLQVIAKDCDRLMAMLPASLLEYTAKANP